ncbi:MAG: hypothetical protein GC136_09245 [Alphaproteobacteria bacterium]|nr:hypothetical protein [Alphaproteobacteria bacterium]
MGYQQGQAAYFMDIAAMPIAYEQALVAGASHDDALQTLRDSLPPHMSVDIVRVQNSTAIILLDENTGEITVAFDGSDEAADRRDDMRFWNHDHAIGGDVHSGMWHSVMRENGDGIFLDQVRDRVTEIAENYGRDVSLNITGFSRGGAMAHVAAGQWLAEGFPLREQGLGVDIRLDNVYAFGSLPVGDRDFVRAYEGAAQNADVNIVSVNVAGDGITGILGPAWRPLTLLGAPSYNQAGQITQLEAPEGSESIHSPAVYQEAIQESAFVSRQVQGPQPAPTLL